MAHHLAAEAAGELDDIWYYIASESGSIERADRFIDAITERFYTLSKHPHIGPERNELRHGLRSFSVGDYIILYRISNAEDVLILHVLRSRKNIQGSFR